MIKTEKDSIMETITNTSDNTITNSYKEYHQVILTYITYRITHRYEAEDLTQDVFVRLLDYKQMLRPDTVKYFLFTIARNIVIDYIRRYYKKQEIDSYIYDTMSTFTNETEEKITIASFFIDFIESLEPISSRLNTKDEPTIESAWIDPEFLRQIQQ